MMVTIDYGGYTWVCIQIIGHMPLSTRKDITKTVTPAENKMKNT